MGISILRGGWSIPSSIAIVLLLSTLRASNGRAHYHKHKYNDHNNNNKYYHSGDYHMSHISQPPAPSPAEPPSPSDEYSSDSNSSSGSCSVFNVRSFGAVGNGSSDDTQAFRSAWKAACAVESAVLLVPSDGVFTVTSTIFSGPCLPGFVLQVG